MSPLTKSQKKDLTAIVDEVDQFLDSRDIADLTPAEIEKVAKLMLIDKLKDRFHTEIKKRKIDIDALIDTFIATRQSQRTQELYAESLKLFFLWLEQNNKNIHDLTALEADEYILYLKKQTLNNNTIRNKIAAVSSFCAYLVRNDVIEKNYFKGASLPKKDSGKKTSDEIPDNTDITILENALWEEFHATGRGSVGKQRQARNLLVVVAFAKLHALRLGAMEHIKIDHKEFFKTESKGKTISGKLHPEIVELLKKLHLDRKKPIDNSTNTIKIQFKRFCNRLVKEGKLKTVYSLHDLRHYAAVKHYREHKDIIALQRFLGHSNVAITQIYLASLNVEM